MFIYVIGGQDDFAGVLVLGNHFQPNQIFLGKTRSLPLVRSVDLTWKGRLLAFTQEYWTRLKRFEKDKHTIVINICYTNNRFAKLKPVWLN
jgi:hypothetical protein